jgi:hypothetical protein
VGLKKRGEKGKRGRGKKGKKSLGFLLPPVFPARLKKLLQNRFLLSS